MQSTQFAVLRAISSLEYSYSLFTVWCIAIFFACSLEYATRHRTHMLAHLHQQKASKWFARRIAIFATAER